MVAGSLLVLTWMQIIHLTRYNNFWKSRFAV